MHVMSYEEEDTCMVCTSVWCVLRGRTNWRSQRFLGIRCQMTPPTSSEELRASHKFNAPGWGRCFEIQ